MNAAGWYLIVSIVGVAFVTLVSIVIGAICFRFKLRELYFAIVTLAFSELARLVILNWNTFTNGSLGINFTVTPTLWVPGRGVIPVAGTLMWYYLSLAAVILAVIFYSRVVHSWMGRCFASIRLNDQLLGKMESVSSLSPEQQAFMKKLYRDQVKSRGGFDAIKLTLEDAGAPFSPEQIAEIQPLLKDSQGPETLAKIIKLLTSARVAPANC